MFAVLFYCIVSFTNLVENAPPFNGICHLHEYAIAK